MNETIKKIRITSTLYKSHKNLKLNTLYDSIDNVEQLEQIDLK